jgi:FAD:protein FMN transferase
MKKFSYASMGTTWEITLWDDIPETKAIELEKNIIALSHEFDQTYSRFIETSLVWSIAKKPGVYSVPADFINMLTLYRDLYKASDKKLNPLIGNTISDLGYDSDYSLIPKETIRRTPDLLETVTVLDDNTIETKEAVLFDFGALGKGYFVDRVTNYLKENSIDRFLVNGSGDIFYSGGKDHTPIRAGLEHPHDPTLAIGVTELVDGALCASGTNRRSWDKYHHVIDPLTNSSVTNNIVATWVIAPTCALADAIASCLFFVEPEKLQDYTFEYVIMNTEGAIKKSPQFSGEIFS